MAANGGVIYEEYLYKLTGNKGKSFWNKSNPWKQRYFIVKTDGNRPVLEYHAKKPRNRNASPRETISLAGGFRLEKVTNTRNRAYVFELTTGDKYLVLSSDEQRHMDIFVFVLQAQIRLRDQVKEDFVIVQPENSESQRRIGAKGTNCILHVSPWGATLALQSCRSVLAQWPLKSVRYFEASGSGKFMLEAGRVAPMGDGIYVFQTLPGEDNKLYDLLDQYIVSALGKIQPGRRGTTEEVEDYVEEAEKLSALTTVCLFTQDNPAMSVIFMENWNFELPIKTQQVIHTRQNSLSSSNSDTSVPPPLPSRLNSRVAQNSPRLIRSPATTNPNTSIRQQSSPNSVTGARATPITERPPLPPPTNQAGSVRGTSKPVGIPRNHSAGNMLSNENYFRMNSSSSTGSKFQSPTSSSGMWSPPPTFQEVISDIRLYSKDGTLPSKDGYLTPRTSAEMAAQVQANTEEYILPSPKEEKKFNSLTRPNSGTNNINKRSPRHRASATKLSKLKSASCEEMTEYLKGFAVKKSEDTTTDENENFQTYDLAKPMNPFPKLQDFHGSMELLSDHQYTNSENYYNIQGLKGEVDSSHIPRVSVVRRKFNDMCKDNLTRSISNPNFLQLQNKDKLINVRSNAFKSGSLTKESHMEHKQKSKSLLNLFRSKTSRRQSEGSQLVSSSTPSSPTGTLTRQTSTPNIVINFPGIYITERTRSFRRPKSKDGKGDSPGLPTKRKDKSVSPAIRRATQSSTEGVVIRHSREGSNSSSSSASTRDRNGSETSSPVKYARQDSGTITLPVRHSREGSGSANLSPKQSRGGGDTSNAASRHSREGSGSGAGKQGSGSQLINFSRQSSSSTASSKVQTTC